MKERLHARALPLQLPIGQESDFRGVVDLIRNRAIIYKDDLGVNSTETDVPEELREQAALYRERILETVAEYDDQLMEKYFNGEEITPEECYRALRKAVIQDGLVPVFCGSSYRNKGCSPCWTPWSIISPLPWM